MRAALLEGPKHEPNRPPSDYLLVRETHALTDGSSSSTLARDDTRGLTNPPRPSPLPAQVRDRFGHRSWSTCRLCVYSSPSGWYSCTYIIIQPGPPQGLQH